MRYEQHVWDVLTGPGRQYVNDLTGRRDTCVLMARLGKLLFQEAGITCDVLPVVFAAYNRVYVELQAKDQAYPADRKRALEWLRAGAYSVVIDEVNHTPGKFAGHLILETPSYIGDPSLDQASRPEHQLELHAWYLPKQEGIWDEGGCMAVQASFGATVWYRRQERSPSDWATSPDWQTSWSDSLVQHLMKLVSI